jgi:hypothetical protein
MSAAPAGRGGWRRKRGIMNIRMFSGACILAGGLLVKFGAPVPAVVLGIGAAAIWNWKGARLATLLGRSRN